MTNLEATSPPPTCPVCLTSGCSRTPYFYDWLNKTRWLYRCPECSHGFVWPRTTEEEYATIYSDEYFADGGDWAGGYWNGGYAEHEPDLRDEAREVLELLPDPPGRLLDIGCAGGVFLDEARSAGFDVMGIEYNRSMASHARDEYELPVLHDAVDELPLDRFDRRFDVIVLMDVLEHVPDVRAVLDRLNRWTAAGASVLVRGPIHNAKSDAVKRFLRRILRRPKRLPGYPLDANDFTPRSLRTALDIAGFRVREWQEHPGFVQTVATRRD